MTAMRQKEAMKPRKRVAAVEEWADRTMIESRVGRRMSKPEPYLIQRSPTMFAALPYSALPGPPCFRRLFRHILPMLLVLPLFALLAASPDRPAQASKYAAIVIEETTGRVLFARNADKARYPASLTKIMTLYLLFEDLEAGRISMTTRLPVSRVAASRSPSKLYLKPARALP